MLSGRTPTVIAAYVVLALVVSAACRAPQEPPQASSSASEEARHSEPSASLSNQETHDSETQCVRPIVRAAPPSMTGPLRYEVTALDLPVRPADSSYAGLAINDAGQVVGTARIGEPNGFDRAYRWNPGGRVAFIEGSEGQETRAHDLNSSGQVSGGVWSDAGDSRPFVWDEGAGLREVRLEVGARIDWVYGVRLNDRGQVAGTLETEDAVAVAFRGEPDGTVTQAPVEQAQVQAMNEGGEVVLTVEDDTGRAHLYVWQSGTTLIDGGPIESRFAMINDAGLVVAATPAPDGEECGFAWDTRTGSRTTLGLGVSPSAVNGNGQVTGAWTDGDVDRAFLWDVETGLRDLGTLPGFDYSRGVAINNRGQVIADAFREPVGQARVSSFLWDPTAGLIELRPLNSGESTSVLGINNEGVIVGVSGDLDPEAGLIMQGAPVIWSPRR